MSNYHLCCQHHGKIVQIYEKSGKIHHGRIVKVDQEHVWIDPMVKGPRGFGYGYGYGGYGYVRNPYWVPVALAAIGGFALGAAFFW